MKILIFLSLLSVPVFGQNVHPPLAPTIVNFSLHAADAAVTCYNLAHGYREYTLPSQSCAVDATLIEGSAVAAWGADYWLRKHGHYKLAQFQWGVSAVSAYGVAYSLKWHF